jgi:hypothetical protein
MPVLGNIPEVVIWTDSARVPLVQNVIDGMGASVRTLAVGGVTSAANITDLARALACPCEIDLRKLLVEHPAAYVFFASPTIVTTDDVRFALSQGSTILSLEPIAADFAGLMSRHTNEAGPMPGTTGNQVMPASESFAANIYTAPSFEYSKGWASATDPMQAIGPIRLVNFNNIGPTMDCSLFGRLWDAWKIVLLLCGMPETIDAALVPAPGKATEDLRSMTGHLTAHARCGDRYVACVSVSDRASPSSRSIHLVGEQGSLKADDAGYRLHDAQGREIDCLEPGSRLMNWSSLIIQQWRSMIDRPASSSWQQPGSDEESLMACCMASLLSSRTSEPESPAKLLRLQTG